MFRPELRLRVLRCEKWQTRRVTKPNVRVGGVYGVQRRMLEQKVLAPCWMLVTQPVRTEPVGSISEADGIAEGYAGRADFLGAWQSNFDRVDLAQEVFVVPFIPVPVGYAFVKERTTLPCGGCLTDVRLVKGLKPFSWVWEHTALNPNGDGDDVCHTPAYQAAIKCWATSPEVLPARTTFKRELAVVAEREAQA